MLGGLTLILLPKLFFLDSYKTYLDVIEKWLHKRSIEVISDMEGSWIIWRLRKVISLQRF